MKFINNKADSFQRFNFRGGRTTNNMGMTISRDQSFGSKEDLKHSQRIDAYLRTEKKVQENTIKLLLLGTAECGKSTILKQLRVLNNKKFEETEILSIRNVVYHNIFQMSQEIFDIMVREDISFQNHSSEEYKQIIMTEAQARDFADQLSDEVRTALIRLETDANFRICCMRSSDFHLPDSTEYFFNNIQRICDKNYVPDDQDAIRSRVATTGINEIQLLISNINFRIVDVGGQRSERRKWIHCFSDVEALIYLASLADYNMVLYEDSNVNRMLESLKLFGKICGCRWFINVSIILFLNKKDIFTEKLKKFPLTIAFPDFKDVQEFDQCATFIERQYEREKGDPDKQFYVHRTCATDTTNVKMVFDACWHIITMNNMKSHGIN